MSEYGGPGAASRLLTDARDEPSDFIRRMRQQPFTVLLLDEIEKASPDVFDVLLSVFDEGRLTDRYGRVTQFRSSVIVMTSNLGVERGEAFGFGKARPAESFDSAVREFFRPEFFNRMDRVVTFAALGEEVVRRIAEKELRDLAKREGLVKAELTLEWSEEVVEMLARVGFDAKYGARPLQRTMERWVVVPLAKFLVEKAGARKKKVVLEIVDEVVAVRLI
jgi:ATP-dependent Clp protease ATP-binding subunit ClpC